VTLGVGFLVLSASDVDGADVITGAVALDGIFDVVLAVQAVVDSLLVVDITVLDGLGAVVVLLEAVTGDVHGKDVVTLAAVKPVTEVDEVTADLLLVVDVPGSCSFFEVVFSIVDGDVALETVEEKIVMTGGVDFLVL